MHRSRPDYLLVVRDNPGMAICGSCGAEIPGDARFCPTCGAPVAAERPAEERKLATVVFADLVGSTALAGSEDPERTRVVLDRFYDAMAEEIERAGGTIEKFAGDAVMAAFGAPSALEDHAERALHAALAMQRRLAELFEGRLELRIGINTGDVVVGKLVPEAPSSAATRSTLLLGWSRLPPRCDPRRRAHRRRRAWRFRVRAADSGRCEGETGRRCSATGRARAFADAAARRQRPCTGVRRP